MPITSICWRCGRIYPLADSLAGARGPCGGCGAELLVPTSPPRECARRGEDIPRNPPPTRPGEPPGRLYCQPCYAANANPRHALRPPTAAQCRACKSFHPSTRLIRTVNAFVCHACHSTAGPGRRIERTRPSRRSGKHPLLMLAALLLLLFLPILLILTRVHSRRQQQAGPQSAASFLPQFAP